MTNAEKYKDRVDRRNAFWTWITSFPTEKITPEYVVSEFSRWLDLEFPDEEKETVENILHEMRDAANLNEGAIKDKNHLLSDWYYDDECQGWLTYYADRIEDAWKRFVFAKQRDGACEADAKMCIDNVMEELKKAVPGYSYVYVKNAQSIIRKYNKGKNKERENEECV